MVLNVAHFSIPPAYKLMIIASSPSRRRWPMALPGRGVKVPARSRGTSISKGPTSESTVLGVVPFLALLRAWEVGSPFS